MLALIYAKPVLDKKVLYQHDMIQAKGSVQEVVEFEKKTGEHSLWTSSMFAGMPTYTVLGKYPLNLTSTIAAYISYGIPQPINLIFYLLVGFYLMMVVLNFNKWISVLGAVAFAFSSYNFLSIEAGHVSKILAIAYAPPLIAGTVLLYRGKYFLGSIITIVFVTFELYANHIQITYYLFIALFLYVIFELVNAIRTKTIRQFAIASAIIVLIGGLCIGAAASRFWTMYEYSKYTIRGASELKSNTESQGGLDKDYAFSWSYGIGETFTFLVPNIYGGQSQGSLDRDSETYKVISRAYGAQAAKGFVENDQLPLYWGDQPSTGGPAYLGAIVCFLFIFGLFVIKNPLKWWALSVVVLFTMLSWGKNFDALTDFFFNNIPLYNKFRAVTMIHSLVAIVVSLVAVWAVKSIVESVADKDLNVKNTNYLKFISIGFGVLLLVFVLMGDSFFTFERTKVGEEMTSDEYFQSSLEKMTNDKNMAASIFEALVQDRASLMKEDSLRSLIFIILTVALLWLFLKYKFDARILYGVLILLMLVDLWPVSKRYLNNDDFIPKKKYNNQFQPSEADLVILQDTDPNFKVMNRTVSTFNDATTSYFHKSIGGYSAAKMRRYQDLIEKHISQGNMNVLNMLNTKYIIQDDQGGTKRAYRNPDALGHAWFVNDYIWVNTPDEEIDTLDGINPKTTAVIDQRFKEKVGNLSIVKDTSAGVITLTQYKPNYLIYETATNSNQLAVFSEIYYNNELGWESYVDGKPYPHFRANYILRGMVVPAGKHKIEFKFYPTSYYNGEKIALVCSLLLLGAIAGLVFIKFKKNKVEDIEL